VFPVVGEGLDALFSLYRTGLLCFTREPLQVISTIHAPENGNGPLQEIHLFSLPFPVEDPSLLTPQLPNDAAGMRVSRGEGVAPLHEPSGHEVPSARR
jgi:hypothetical protein